VRRWRDEPDLRDRCRQAVWALDEAVSMMRAVKETRNEAVVYMNMPDRISVVAQRLADVFRVLGTAGLANTYREIDQEGTYSCYYQGREAGDRESDNAARAFAVALIEGGMNGDEATTIHRTLEKVWESPFFHRGCDWLILLLLGLVGALCVPRKRAISETDSKGGDAIRPTQFSQTYGTS